MSDLLVQALLIGLAAWRVSSLLAQEGGPFDVFTRLRALPLETSFEEGVPDWCLWCLSPWAAAAMYGVWELEPVVVMVVAASTVVVLVQKWAME